MVVLFGLAGVGLTGVSLLDWRQLDENVQALERQGWTTTVVSAGSEGASGSALVDARSCANLSTLDGVRFVAAIGPRVMTNFVQLAGRPVPVVVVAVSGGPDLTAVGNSKDRTNALIGPSLLATLGSIRTLDVPGWTRLTVVGIASRQLSVIGLDGSVVIPVPLGRASGPVAECAAQTDPAKLLAGRAAIPSSLTIASLSVVSRQVTDGPPVHPFVAFLHRASLEVFVAVGVMIGLMTGLVLRSRSSDLGVYRVTGTSRVQILVLLGLEQLLLLGIWVATAVASSLWITRNSSLPVSASLAQQSRAIIAQQAVALVLACLFVQRSVFTLLKDR